MAVEAVQTALVAQGFLAAKDDTACFDEATRQAVLAFQAINNLEPTGMMDDDTLTLLLWGMLDPRLVSQRNALAMGFEHCRRCKPHGYFKP